MLYYLYNLIIKANDFLKIIYYIYFKSCINDQYIWHYYLLIFKKTLKG